VRVNGQQSQGRWKVHGKELEDKELKNAVQKHDGKNWDAIARL
jgi:hypothetical protein